MLCGEFFMLDYIKRYIEENFKNIVVLLGFLVIGIIFGLIFYQFLPPGTKEELVNTLRTTLDLCKNENFENINVIKNGVMSNSILVLVIYTSAITLVAPAVICITCVFKGFSIGLYIPTLFEVLGFGKGILSLFLLVIIPNIIYIPAFVYLAVNSINFHFNLVNSNINRFKLVISEGCKLILGISIIVLSVIVEQLLSFVVIKMYMGMQ